ncbi:hypothetical protein HPB50_012808 [Hyalomma asiaticum]|uniref:Uncharacterized protein n=1 Tax=Hyalomma asiaticum TaxID=266040 RepID=A0ACB7RUF1_HYAAI|nr:hypothetical protein HPB50_012808 [Hyalomma asiaticum]
MCYEQCRHEDCCRCPLDGEETLERDVHWMEFPVQNLLSRKAEEQLCYILCTSVYVPQAAASIPFPSTNSTDSAGSRRSVEKL